MLEAANLHIWVTFQKVSEEMGVCASVGVDGEGVKNGAYYYCYNSKPVPFTK